MIPQNSQKEEKKQAMSNAERKQKQREKERLQKLGTFEKSLLDLAKEELLTIANYDIEILLSNEKYKCGLDNGHLKQLSHFRSYNLQKLKKQQMEQSTSEKQQQNNIEKVQRLANLQIPQLHQSLLIPQSTIERRVLIKSKIEENLFLFLEYMEQYQTPTSDFLEIVIELCLELQEETSTKLFVRVCFMHKGEQLIITKDMAEKAMQYLVDNKIDNIAAHGLLRLAFQNDISFSTFPVDLLIQFQNEYQQTLLSFYKSIPLLPQQLVESLPASCFCLTTPMISALKEAGKILHTQVPPQFLPSFIEILCYSFTDTQEEFEKFVKVFKDGCMKHYEALIQKKFYSLLQVISDFTYSMNKNFFKKLTYQTMILERAFELLLEKKISIFDKENINQLIQCNNEAFQILKLRPKIMKESSVSSLNQILKNLSEQNEQLNFYDIKEQFQLSQEEQLNFRLMNISSLLPIQQICYKYCLKTIGDSKQFIQYDTGQGKTSICLGLSIILSSIYPNVMILNKSKYLTFRDFKKASQIIDGGLRKVILANNQNLENIWVNNIIFLTLDTYALLCQTENIQKLQDICVIIDEYDSLLFEDNPLGYNISSYLSFPKKIIAFTGSKLFEFQKQYIKNIFQVKTIDMTLPQNCRNEQIKKQVKLFHTTKNFINESVKHCLNQIKLTPIVIIIEQNCIQLKNKLEKKGIPVELFKDKDEQYIESSLTTFNQKIKNNFQVFIVDSSHGRGLDFLSSHEIEQNGGVYLIISCLPKYSLQLQQFIGRTGRIGGKGQYSIILYDNNAKNQDPEVYINKKLQEIENRELTRLSDQYQNFDIVQQQNASKQINQLEEKNDVPQIQKSFFEQNVLNPNINYDDIVDIQENINTFLTQNNQKATNKNDSCKMVKKAKGHNQIKKLLSQNKRVQKFTEKLNMRYSLRIQNKQSPQSLIDQQYFQSYEDPLIHKEMLEDQIRMKAFEQAISKVANGKVIIDVGAGTAVLSMIAARNGSQKIYAIEYSQICKQAQENIIKNNFQDQIVLINDRAEDFFMEGLKVDIIISEWMGYFMIFENMLPSVICVRDKYLKDDGIIIPSRGQIFISAFTNTGDFKGINISLEQSKGIENAIIETIQESRIVTNNAIILDLDLKTDYYASSNFENTFELSSNKSCSIQGFVVWFDVTLIDDITLSTGPNVPPTHWKQTSLILKNKLDVEVQDLIQGEIKVKPLKDNYRGLSIKISYKTKDMTNFRKQYWKLE